MPRKKSVHRYLLDTNILMKYPMSMYGFQDNEVIITATTIEELDNHKNDVGERGFMARRALAKIDELRALAKEQKTSLSKGVHINDGKGLFRIENEEGNCELPLGWDLKKADNTIIAVCKNLNCELVTEDRGLAIKADDIGVSVSNYRNAEITPEVEYTGRGEIYMSSLEIAELMRDGKVRYNGDEELVENQYLRIYNTENPSKTVLGRYYNGSIKKLIDPMKFGKIQPRNEGQWFALDALLAPPEEIPLVILSGEAGTAKTFLAITGAMYGYGKDYYTQIIATRNNVGFDTHDVGALPGDELAKVSPLLRGLTDNLQQYLRCQGTDERDIRQSVEDYLESDIISIQSMDFMRGRSISNSCIILDEVQNATPHQVKGIITRIGEGTKCILTGDPYQIDAVRLDRKNCGLTYAAAKMKGSPYTAQIMFKDEECTRSIIALDASIRMRDDFA